MAYRSIATNRLRSWLTIIIIALGIMALIGIATAIEALKGSISGNFTVMGANSFSFKNREPNVEIGKRGKKPKEYRRIKYEEALQFKKVYDFPAKTTISSTISNTATITFNEKKTNPNVRILSVDEDYFSVNNMNFSNGKAFSNIEIKQNMPVAVLGIDVATLLFKKPEKAIQQVITADGKKYIVIGVLQSKGVSQFFSSDNIVYIPINLAKINYGIRKSCVISVSILNNALFEPGINEAESMFRVIRKNPLTETNNFDTQRSDDLAQELISNLTYVNAASIFIGMITLLGAAVALMNIMLVSVQERTREIGISKAVGASNTFIIRQFILEALVICQIGGILGIVLGILSGNILTIILGGSFVIPWLWIIFGFMVCILVGLAAGIYPALKAAKLNPISALRVD